MKTHRGVVVLSAVSLSMAIGSPAAWAQLQNGDILVPERMAGSVVNIRDGGDFMDTPRFATGLTMPTGLCQGPGGDIYSTEQMVGEVISVRSAEKIRRRS